ncbi:MAG: 3-oxoacyl-ACP reductase FabG [Oscillospiraceae bacterium]|jgi:3-oxoacyl-[acyl-carrier protein] reductase|nr:3-oxoacyl-ACP reductase FabG [Oscillospiraceae bacterium]MDD3832376.1 3-oxoacyl-ACP reductase FabG [Oscillospiraceae bacterium]MDD4546799.1 3-oxoacyl-ACP reductase FabG [Oscillospiraceae bacterium]
MVNKTVLITGASKGIGRATAELFGQHGYSLILNYNTSEAQALELADKLKNLGCDVLPYKADVTDREQVEQMVAAGEKEFGGIDILVSNAGKAEQCLFTDITPEQWREMMAVCVDAAYYCCRSVLPHMIRRHQGKIIFISSVWGMVGASCEVHYSTAKAALIGMTKSLAKELGPTNITVNCVAPGVIDTDMNSGLNAQTRKMLEQETPLGRIGTPLDVANSVLFLASEQADFITGQVISPNGGLTII